jgi:hypothetical protein
MIGLVLAALGGARVARLGADATDGGGEVGAPTHVPGTGPAKLGTVAARPDAAGHLDVADAGVAAVFALLGACHARVDAASVEFVRHVFLLERAVDHPE